MKNIFLLNLLIFISANVFSQIKLEHKKKVYISPEGRMFVNKSLPIYLRLSTSPDDNAPSYILKSESCPQYTNPMYFDTEGYNSIRSPWQVDTVTKKVVLPNQDIIFEVYADSKSPITKPDLKNIKTLYKEGKLFISTSKKLAFESYDELSGVENIYLSLNSEPFKVYSEPVNLEKEGEYFIQFYAVDNVGNVEETKKINIVLDITPPKTSMLFDIDYYENIISSKTKITFKSTDEGSGINSIYYSLDDKPFQKYLYPISASFISQGEHKITFYAIDNLNNKEDFQTTNIYVDKTPPLIVQEIIGKTFFANGKEYSSGKGQLKITALDNKAGVKDIYYSINGEEYKKYEGVVNLSNFSGSISIKSYAIDNVNNKSEALEKGGKTSIPYVDLSGPIIKYNFSGPFFLFKDTIYISKNTSIKLSAIDNESGLKNMEFSINNENFVQYTSPFKIENEGLNKLLITAFDNVENSNNEEVILVVDNNGPDIYEKYSIPAIGNKRINDKEVDVYPSHVIVFLSSTDKIVGTDYISYSINSSSFITYSSPIKNFKKNEYYKLIVKAFDKLGNQSIKEIEFFIGD